ncbi:MULTISPECIES: HD domain-containing protein [unclassified Streptomyces]|uniref:HD domain-containing protein n=1 Tax=unclassified Streptomyces TaxID=2593676 RepID=UPI001CED2EDC|nr:MULTISPECIES: HD domain-containing protein [unclassified Streptomyces]
MRTHHPDADVSLIQHAHDEAAVWHAGQTRRSGDPFLTHCLAVAAIVTDIGMPPSVICAAVLHDIDDTPCPPGRVAEHFGQEIADLISAVRTAKLAAIPLTALDFGVARSPAFKPTREEAVLAIRLADPLHNLRTIAFVAPTRRYLVARETLDVIAPLARAAGLTDVSREPHDLSSAALQPTPTASAVTTRMLAMLILLLPTPTRARWREERQAERAALPTRRARTRFTLRVLLSTPRLSWTLRRAACRDVTCFTTEEEGVGLASRAPWLLETDVQEKVGVNFSRGPIWEPYIGRGPQPGHRAEPGLGRGPGQSNAGNPQVKPSRPSGTLPSPHPCGW